MSIFKKIIIIPTLLTFVFIATFILFYLQNNKILADIRQEVKQSHIAVKLVYQESTHQLLELVKTISFDPLIGPEPDTLTSILYDLRKYKSVLSAYIVDTEENILGDGLDSEDILALGQPIPQEFQLNVDLSKPIFEIQDDQLVYSEPIVDQGDPIGRLQVIISL